MFKEEQHVRSEQQRVLVTAEEVGEVLSQQSGSVEGETSRGEEEGEDECEYDEEIQEFIDEEPQRERDAGIGRITYQLKDLIGNIDGIKDTTIQLLNDFKKVVKTDDVENLPEEEKKLYQTLNDMTQLTLKFPKPEVEKETYDPF